jgi:exopolysaccharide biosynthesis polyprenyl glycosylphosphotransferase
MTSLSESNSRASAPRERGDALVPARLFAANDPGRDISAARRRQERRSEALLVVADAIGLVSAFAVTRYLLSASGSSAPIDLVLLLTLLPAWIVGAKFCGLYDRDKERVAHSTPDDVVHVFVLTTVCFFLITQFGAFTGAITALGGARGDGSGLSAVFVFWVLALVLILAARSLARAVTRRSKADLQRTVVVGAGHVGQVIARRLVQHREYRIKLVGVVDERPRDHSSADDCVPAHLSTPLGGIPILGAIDEIYKIVKTHGIARAIFAVPSDQHAELANSVRTLRASGVHVDIVPVLAAVIGPNCDVDSVEGISVLGLAPVRLPRSAQYIKRTIDLLAALVGLIVAAPVLVVIAVAVKATSPGPVLFRQTRLGKHMRPFTVLKFRTMKVDTDQSVHEDFIAATMRDDVPPAEDGLFKLNRDADVTSIGRWLRRTSLDELPQLLNVVYGDMSLVGPRPCIPYEVKEFEPHHFDRFLVPAGLTGLWQTSARARATYGEALDLDALYAQNWSLRLDFAILARTPPELLSSRATQ